MEGVALAQVLHLPGHETGIQGWWIIAVLHHQQQLPMGLEAAAVGGDERQAQRSDSVVAGGAPEHAAVADLQPAGPLRQGDLQPVTVDEISIPEQGGEGELPGLTLDQAVGIGLIGVDLRGLVDVPHRHPQELTGLATGPIGGRDRHGQRLAIGCGCAAIGVKVQQAVGGIEGHPVRQGRTFEAVAELVTGIGIDEAIRQGHHPFLPFLEGNVGAALGAWCIVDGPHLQGHLKAAAAPVGAAQGHGDRLHLKAVLSRGICCQLHRHPREAVEAVGA